MVYSCLEKPTTIDAFLRSKAAGPLFTRRRVTKHKIFAFENLLKKIEEEEKEYYNDIPIRTQEEKEYYNDIRTPIIQKLMQGQVGVVEASEMYIGSRQLLEVDKESMIELAEYAKPLVDPGVIEVMFPGLLEAAASGKPKPEGETKAPQEGKGSDDDSDSKPRAR